MHTIGTQNCEMCVQKLRIPSEIFRGGVKGNQEHTSPLWYVNISASLRLLTSCFVRGALNDGVLNKHIIMYRDCHKQHNKAYHIRDVIHQIRCVPRLFRQAHTCACRQVLARGCFQVCVCRKTLRCRPLWNLSLWLQELT